MTPADPTDRRDAARAGAAAAVLALHPDGLATAEAAGVVASHDTAARVYEWWTPSAPPGLHVTGPAQHPARSRSGLTVHHVDLLPRDRLVLAGVPLTAPLRTLLDLLRDAEELWAVAAVESALRGRWVFREDVDAFATTCAGWPWVVQVRQRLALVDDRSESALETAGRLIFTHGGVPPTDLQRLLPGDPPGRERRADMVWEDEQGRVLVAVEMDGREEHEKAPAAFTDRRKDADMGELGWQVRRFTWHDVRTKPGEMVDRVRRVLARAA